MDIEDSHILLEHNRTSGSTDVVKARFRSRIAIGNVERSTDVETFADVPDVYKVFVQTWGCTHNTSDSEYMAGLLAQYGYRVTLGGAQKLDNSTADQKCDLTEECCTSAVDSEALAKQEADVWILNSCTVKGPAEDHFRNAVLTGIKLGKHVVVAGCVPQGRPESDYLKGVSVVGVQQIDRVVEVVEETLRGNTVRFLEKKFTPGDADSKSRRLGGAPLDLPKIRRNPLIEILAISTGCLNACTYCKTKHARGVLASYPIEQLLERAKQAFADGVKELWLTSEDLGAYGRDLSRSSSSVSCPTMATRFPDCLTLTDLLAGLLPLIPAGCMLRLGMTNPPYILDQLTEMVTVLSHPRVYAFIHIPVQSGSDAVLDRMKREYTADEFCHVVTYLKEHITAPSEGCGSLTVATDIICGFPNETDADFEQTVNLVERFQFPVLYINQFFARPGTPAASMPRKATTADVKKRTKRLHELFRTYSPYTDRLGCEVRVLVTEVSRDGRYWVGHTKAYEQVLVPKVPQAYGCIVLVRIVECDKFFMRSEIVDLGPFDSLLCQERESQCWTCLPILKKDKTTSEPKIKDRASSVEIKDWHKPESRWLIHLGLLLLITYMLLKFLECRGIFDSRSFLLQWF